ncbi:alpha-tocopherol transfer protein-like [Manduca sexta]|uniref:alpha-tocopherol transfer protein-like n=1 Tax=Manduca sexta TaxID=7130 RepID=UPI001890790B|nr:alpha-tocopherol transfer protein-like [Manduca sexta]
MSRVESFPLEEEYKKPTGITPQDIARLRQWLATQPHLPQEHITDLDLILLYHRYGCSIEVSKQELDNQYTLRTLFASFFKDRVLDEKIETVLNTVLITILPGRSKEGHTILYGRMIDTDVSKFDFPSSIRAMLMVLDLWQYAEGTWPGFMFLFDLHGIKVGLLSKLDLENIRQFVVYFPGALLAKLKGVHFLNAPTFMDRLNAIMRNFMTKEFIDLVTIHQAGDLSGITKVVDLEVLPKELGGNYKTLEELREETQAMMRANKDFFVEENKKRVKESLRPGKPKTITDIFGSVEGTFKQLEID